MADTINENMNKERGSILKRIVRKVLPGVAVGAIAATTVGQADASNKQIENAMGPQGTTEVDSSKIRSVSIPGSPAGLEEAGLKIGTRLLPTQATNQQETPEIIETPTIRRSDTTIIYNVRNVANPDTASALKDLEQSEITLDQFNSIVQKDTDQNAILQDATLSAYLTSDLRYAWNTARSSGFDPGLLDTKLVVLWGGQGPYIFPEMQDQEGRLYIPVTHNNEAFIRRLDPGEGETVGFLQLVPLSGVGEPVALPVIIDSNRNPSAIGVQDPQNPDNVDLVRANLEDIPTPRESFELVNEAGEPVGTMDPQNVEYMVRITSRTLNILDQTYNQYLLKLKDGRTVTAYARDLSSGPESAPLSAVIVSEAFTRNNIPDGIQSRLTERLNLPITHPDKISINADGEFVNTEGDKFFLGMTPGNENLNSGFLKNVETVRMEGTDVTLNINLNQEDMANRPADQDRVIDIDLLPSIARDFIKGEDALGRRLPEGSIINVNLIAEFDSSHAGQDYAWIETRGILPNGQEIISYAYAIDIQTLPNGGQQIDVRMYAPGSSLDIFSPETIVSLAVMKSITAAVMGVNRPGQVISSSLEVRRNAYAAMGLREMHSTFATVTLAETEPNGGQLAKPLPNQTNADRQRISDMNQTASLERSGAYEFTGKSAAAVAKSRAEELKTSQKK